MGERRALGRSLVALTAAICTLGALAITPAANAKTVASASASDSNQTVKAAAAGATGFVALPQCPADNPNNANNPNEMVYVTPDRNDVGGTLNKGKYVAGLTEALQEAEKYTAAGVTDVYVDLVGHQNVPSPDKNNPKTLDVNAKIHLNGQGCRLDGQLNFGTGSAGSTVKNVDFRMTDPNQNTGNILTAVPITVQNNLFRLPNSSVQMKDTANGANKANAKRPVGVVIGGGNGSKISNNKFQSDSDTGLPAHDQVQGVRLAYDSTDSLVSNNQFDVPTGVALFAFKGTGNIQDNTFSGKYAVADTSASNPNGLTYLEKPIAYDQQQGLNGNTLVNAWPYRSVFAGNGKNGVGEFRGTSYGVCFINAKDAKVLGSGAVVQKTDPTSLLTRTGFYAELYKDKDGNQLFNAAADMTNNHDGFGEDGATSSDLGALYVKWYKKVIFDLNGGTGENAPAAQKVYEDKSIDSLPDVTVTTNTASLSSADEPSVAAVTPPNGKGKFLGWSTDKNATTTQLTAGSKFTPEDNSPADITLYAVYENTFTVKFDLNGGTGDAPGDESVVQGQSLAKLPDVSMQAPNGKTFVGWSTVAGSDTADAVAPFTPKADITLHAVWAAKQYTVQFLAGDGGTGGPMKDQTFTYGVKQKLSANQYSKTGHKFSGWKVQGSADGNIFTDEQEVEIADLPVDPNNVQTIVLVAQWDATTAKITYKVNLPAGVTKYDGKTDDTEGEINQPVKVAANGFAIEGYKFVKWTEKADGSGQSYDPAQNATVTLPKGGVTLYAQWAKREKVVVSYTSANAGDVVPNEHDAVVGDDGAFPLSDDMPVRDGYTFTGWLAPNGKVYPKGARVPFADLNVKPGEKVTMVAQWQRNSTGGNGGNTGGNGGSNNNGGSGSGQPSVRLIDVHRYYNFRTGEHFYTWDQVEMATLTKAAGWNYEGIAFRMSPDQGQRVYRLYNPGGKHLFTTSENERDVLMRSGWRLEGVPFYVPSGASVKVYRLYNPGNGDHLLTTSANERGVVLFHKWNDEKTAFNSAK